MAALSTIRNDGPDILEIRLVGKGRRIIIRPGEEIRINLTVAIQPAALPPNDDDLPYHRHDPCRQINGD